MNYAPINNPFYNQPTFQNRMTNNNRITWVKGIEGVMAFQMEPNSNGIFLDSDIQGRMYIKTCDNIGMCNLRIFNYEEVAANTQSRRKH